MWQMPFERIREERRSADELLLLMSFFNAQGKGIPMWLLEAIAGMWNHVMMTRLRVRSKRILTLHRHTRSLH
jgi:hypothetical protein